MTAPMSRTGATDREVEARDAAGREYFAGGLQGGYVESRQTFDQEMVGPSVAFRAGWARSAEWHAARAAAGPGSGRRERVIAELNHHINPAIGWWRLADSEGRTFDIALLDDRFARAADAILALLAEQPVDHSARESVSHSPFPKSYTREGRARAARNGPGESGVICSDCGWLVGGPNAHPNAEAQHRQHLAEQPGGGK